MGLRIAWKYGVKDIIVKMDSEMIVKQVRKLYATKNQRMKQYKHAVWEFIEIFDSFNIIHHDRIYNIVVEKLVVLGSRF